MATHPWTVPGGRWCHLSPVSFFLNANRTVLLTKARGEGESFILVRILANLEGLQQVRLLNSNPSVGEGCCGIGFI